MATDCAQLEAARKRWLRVMWASPLFSAKRRDAEKKANAAARAIAACKKGGKKGGTSAKGGAGGYPKASPEALWRMDPTKRPVDVFGVVSPGGEDGIIAIAKGARTSFATRALDDRATIRGGLSVLYSAGASKVDPKTLTSQLVQGPKADAALVKAARGRVTGKGAADLKAAADRVRQRVTKAGLERAAWGARGLYILENLKGFGAARGVGGGVSALFGPIGIAIAAAIGIHGSISNAVAKEAAQRFTGYVKHGMGARHGGANSGSASAPPPTPPSMAATPQAPLWPWLVGAGALLVGAVYISGNKSPSSHSTQATA